MSEKHLKLKLKRKKSVIQEATCEEHSSTFFKKSTDVPIPFPPCNSELSILSKSTENAYDNNTGVWWDNPNLQDAEKLWAVTLKCAIPYLGQDVWEMVPALPLASTVTCSVEEQPGWKWCALNEEVSHLPSPLKPSAVSSAGLNATDPILSSEGAGTPPNCNTHKTNPSQQKGSDPAQERGKEITFRIPAPLNCLPGKEMGQQLENPSSRWKIAGGMGQGGCASRPHSFTGAVREENVAVGRASLKGARSGGAEGGMIKQQLPASAGDGPDRCAPAEEPGCAKSPMEEGDVSGNAGANWNSGGGARAAAVPVTMESCPMCLLRFPAGFTQMECDSHLARCLSEMSEDITW
ncbi:hypothetical protein AGOR_G00134960 [Albula goreensis]|uniref:UBZ2-type domain-containing protein n=1 Tax=Albula goreensis TaxID=1534307 RepID=A0A8T3D8Z7_9TELE|nr:hypothetical protein AGOR_G00134960 [Albula goreensis]